MSPAEALQCVRCVLFENFSDDAYPYTFSGSGFLLEFEGKVYFLTAQHCMLTMKRLRQDRELSILADATYSERDFLPYDLTSNFSSSNSDDPDRADLRIFRVKLEALPSTVRNQLRPFSLTRTTFSYPWNGLPAFTRGYPFATKEIDAESMRISLQAFMTEGCVAGPDNSAKYTFVFEYLCHPELEDPNGMSGAPVLTLLPYGVCFSGMIIRGGTGTFERNGRTYSSFRFLGAEIILRGLNRMESQFGQT